MLPLTVRSLGTEGRKKDGQQIPPGGRVYEYILFRISEIKDLQVKSSPPVELTPQFNNDPAAIQSHYPHPVTTSTSSPSVASASLADHSSHATQLGNPGSNFQGPSPLYQPEGNIGSWGTSPSTPNANGGGLTMLIDSQGYYAAPNEVPQLHQSLLPPTLGCSIPSSFQQPMQYSDFSPSLPTGSSNLPELPSSFLPVSTSTPSLTSASLPLSNLSPEPFAFPWALSTLNHAPPAKLASETLPVSLTNKAANLSLPAVPLVANFPSPALTNSGSDINAIVQPLSIKPNALYCSSSTYETVPQLSHAVGSSNSISTETQAPSLVTPSQFLQPVPSVVSSDQHSQTPHKDVEIVQVSSGSSPKPSLPVFAENQPPILPLAVTSWPYHMPGGAPIQTHHGYNERRRGTGVWHPLTKFTEEFGFMAKKEKSKKDRVQGHLGKSRTSHSKEKDEEENAFIEDGDAFFDSLSSDELDQVSQNGRTKYSEQIKNDTETIGDFVSNRGGRGGRDPSNGGRGGHDPSNGGRGGCDPSNGGRGGHGPSDGGRGGRGPSDGGRGGRGPSDGDRGGRGPSDGGRGGRGPSNGGRGGRGPSNGGRGGRGPSKGGRGGHGPSDGGRGGHGPSNGGRGGRGSSTNGRGPPPSRGGGGGRGPSRGGRGGDGPSRGGHHSRGGYYGRGRGMPSQSS